MKITHLTPEFLTSLPVDRRAVELLRGITAEEGREFFCHRRDVRLDREQNVWHGSDQSGARAYEEAFDWLIRHGLVSREPSQSTVPDWFFVTEAGWKVAESDTGLAEDGRGRTARSRLTSADR